MGQELLLALGCLS